MAYEYLRLHARKLLNDISRDVFENGNSMEDIYFDINMYNFDSFFNDIMSSVLCIYGIYAEIKKVHDLSEYNHIIYNSCVAYDITVVDYYGEIDGNSSFELIFNEWYYICDDYRDDSIIFSFDKGNKCIVKNIVDYLLDPLLFFEDEFIMKVINNRADYYVQLFWLLKCMCDMYLANDLLFVLLDMVAILWI